MIATGSSALLERLQRFLQDPEADRFETLALAAFTYQYQHVEPFRRLCNSRGLEPARVKDWRQIPLVPTRAFGALQLAAAPAEEIFRSSGTTGGPRSVHYHPFPNLYRQVIDASFPAFCLPKGERPAMLSLIPSRRQVPDSSLGFMVEHVLDRYGSPDSQVAFGPRGVETAQATAWCADRQEEGEPAFVLATAFALAQWLEALAAEGQGLSLPAGSVVFETGGFKGRTREIARPELLAMLETRLGIPEQAVVREYGMTELTSQLYSRALLGSDPERLTAPHWLRVRVLDPQSLDEVETGEVGLIALFDLANIGSAISLLTEDLGCLEPQGLRLLGRADQAQLRGCSLTVEELTPLA